MAETSTVPSPAELSLLRGVIRAVSRAHRLSATDAEDFAQNVHMRLLERQYDVFARFAGRSSLRTFLTVVITRMLLDWRIAAYGKWRPCAVASRLGADAVELDRLISRDGYSAEQAVEAVSGRPGARAAADLRDIVSRLATRSRPRFVSDDLLDNLPDQAAASIAATLERREATQHARRALAFACRQLDPDDKRLLSLRYRQALSVPEIGRRLQVDAKALYRRLDSTLRRLRQALTDAGVEA